MSRKNPYQEEAVRKDVDSMVNARGATQVMWASVKAIFKSSISRDPRDGSADGINVLTVAFGCLAAAGAAVATPFTFAYDKITGADKGHWFEQGGKAAPSEPPATARAEVKGQGHGKTQERSQDAPITDKTVDMMANAQVRAEKLGGPAFRDMVAKEFNAHTPEKLNAMVEKASEPAKGKDSRDRFITSLLKRKAEYSKEDMGVIKKTPFKERVMGILRGRQVQTAAAKT